MEFQGVATGERGFRERDAEQNRLDHLRDEYYKKDFGPGDVTASGATLTTLNSNDIYSLSASATDLIRVTFVKPELWRNGQLSIIAYWSTDGVDTNTQSMRAQVRAFGVLDSAMANVSILDQTQSLTPTGVADVLHDDDWTTNSNNVLDTHKMLSALFQRLGSSDSNGDVTYWLGMTVKFFPANRQ